MTTVLLLVDGLRPDALSSVDAPRVEGLMRRGASSLRARSVMPSITLPCHVSIFHSVPPQRHGVMTNAWQPMARPLPGLIEQAKQAGKRCYFFHNWEPLRDLNRPEMLELAFYQNTCYTPEGDRQIAEIAARWIAVDRPDFAFVYFGTVDVAGHQFGWMSDAYLRQIEQVDKAVGMVLDALQPADTVLLQSDHGGHDRTHGTESAEDMLIPWVIAGPSVRRNYVIQTELTLLDTAPTLARILQIPAHPLWEGRCIDEIFEM
ncbi:MAG: alkaline phosphatase family protein [Caldilinea sp.]|nr:alkaline phosphatase family protein [Caldilinea sp.]MDW8439921.1 alkaline phosphatase family protein [Caldilineaceae bacterium]